MMNLDKVNSFAKFYETGKTVPNRTAETKFKGSSGLDDAEKSMINKAFPEAKRQCTQSVSLRRKFPHGTTGFQRESHRFQNLRMWY